MTEVPRSLRPPPDTAARVEDLRRMIGMLGLPVAAGSGGARRVGGPGATAVAGILDEIDQTVMARRLLFQNDRDETLTMDVRNRRLLRADLGQLGQLDGTGQCETALLTYAGADDLAALKAALERFCAEGELRVSTTPPSRNTGLEETGVSVGLLRQALSHADDPTRAVTAAAGGQVQRFCSDCAPMVTAWVLDGDGGPVSVHGDREFAARLADVVSAYVEAGGADPDEPANALLLTSAEVTVGTLGFFAEHGTVAAVAIPPGQVDAVLSLWTALYRPASA